MAARTTHVTQFTDRLAVSCEACGLSRLCLPSALSNREVSALNDIVRRRRQLPRHAMLFHSGEPMRGVYAVRSGAIKCYDVSPEGEESVLGFSFPGELVGLEALGTGAHQCFAVALETTQYCEIPYRALQDLMAESAGIREHMLRMMGQQLQQLAERSKTVRQRDARLRVQRFLSDYAVRLSARGLDGSCFRLAMERRDIANFLGLTQETVSRALGTLQQQGIVQARGRQIHFLQPPDADWHRPNPRIRCTAQPDVGK